MCCISSTYKLSKLRGYNMTCKECPHNKICKGAIDADKKSIKLIIKIAEKNGKECPVYKWR